MKPALKMTAVRTIGAKGIDVVTINLTGAGYWRMSLWRDDHQLFAIYRYPVDGGMVKEPINKCRIQFSLVRRPASCQEEAGGK